MINAGLCRTAALDSLLKLRPFLNCDFRLLKDEPEDGILQKGVEFEGNETDNEPVSAGDYEADEEESEDYEEESSGWQDRFSEEDFNNNRIELTTGVQEWPDGSIYTGEFGFDLKLGYGEFVWNSGEVMCAYFVPASQMMMIRKS